MKNRFAHLVTDLIVFVLGFASLLAPFIFPQISVPGAQRANVPIMVSLIIILCLFIVLFEAQSTVLDNKMIALLGILIAINSGLRFLENAIPGPAGFSPIFFLIIMTGYFFGSRIGFLMGAMTLLVSALITGGIGPWLPGQMITAGWVGQSAALFTAPIRKLGWKGKIFEIISLAAFGAFWGLLYGAIMNLWFWPFLASSPGQTWTQTAGFTENFQRYSAYYLATSIAWDITRAIGNIIIISIMAKPVLKIFQRFYRRFSFKQIGNIEV
jgi:energy-coupling factor transport system substrate-specific component